MAEELPPREQEILNLLLEGVSPKEIALKLNISHSTVDFHRTNLYSKLGVHSIHELFAKYSTGGKTAADEAETALPVKTGVIIPTHKIGFSSMSDLDVGENSTIEMYIIEEEIGGVSINGVLNIKTNLAERVKDGELFAKVHTRNIDVIQQLRQANGIRFKALGDGKSWSVEFQTNKSTPETNYACYTYIAQTVRDYIIDVDIPYTSLFLPEWFDQFAYDFNKETIKDFAICANFTQGYGSALLKTFDFEIY